jgi:GntR family transcriptional regulator
MNLDLDPSSPIPLYLQIVEQVRRLVALGALRPGDRLPTVRDLAVRVRVNRNTAARAVRQLEREGVVRTRVGLGTFVEENSPAIDPEVLEDGMNRAVDRLLLEAHALGVAPGEIGERLQRRIESLQGDTE